jgi:predicted DNA-binding transcriptional regulator AlpA
MEPNETSCTALDQPRPAPSPVAAIAGALVFEPELRALVGASRTTLWRWIKNGKFPAPLVWPGRAKVWRRDAVLAYLQKLPVKRSNLSTTENASEPTGAFSQSN